MSRLIQIDPNAKLCPEQEGYEFRYHAFEDMEPIKCEVQEIKVSQPKDPIPLSQEETTLPLSNEKLQVFQAKDKFCKDINSKLQQGQLQNKNPYYKEDGIFKRYVEDGKQKFEVVVLPQVLSNEVLQLAHEGLGHNGSPRTYALLKRYYYWKGLKPMFEKHMQACKFCQEHNKQAVKYSKFNLDTPMVGGDTTPMVHEEQREGQSEPPTPLPSPTYSPKWEDEPSTEVPEYATPESNQGDEEVICYATEAELKSLD